MSRLIIYFTVDDVDWVSEYSEIKESPIGEDDYATVNSSSKCISSICQPSAPSCTATLEYESVPGITSHKVCCYVVCIAYVCNSQE